MTETTKKKTLAKNKHMRNYDYFAIIPSPSHFTMLAMNPTTGLDLALLKLNTQNLRFTVEC